MRKIPDNIRRIIWVVALLCVTYVFIRFMFPGLPGVSFYKYAYNVDNDLPVFGGCITTCHGTEKFLGCSREDKFGYSDCTYICIGGTSNSCGRR